MTAVVAAGLGIDAGVERALDLIGIVGFAISGGLLAVRKGFDMVGVLVLAVVTALGGGAIRDVLIGDRPAAIVDEWYLTLSCGTGLVMMVAHRWQRPSVRRTVLVFDAAGLGLFCVTGTLKAIDFGVPGPGTVAIGVAKSSGTRGASGGSTTKPRHQGRWLDTVVANWSRFGPVMPW